MNHDKQTIKMNSLGRYCSLADRLLVVVAFVVTSLFPAFVMAGPYYWGGGATDISGPKPLPISSNELSGVWNATLQNWASDVAGQQYGTFVPGSFAILGYFTSTLEAAKANIRLESDVSLSGIMANMQSIASGANSGFVLSNHSARTITSAGTNFCFQVIAQDFSRGLFLQTNILISGSTPVEVAGRGTLYVYGRSPDYTGPVLVRGYRTQFASPSGAWPGVNQFLLCGEANAAATSYGGAGFGTPILVSGAWSNGPNDQIGDQAVITLSRGRFEYSGRRHNTAQSASTENMRQLVLEPHGILDLDSAGSSGTYPGILNLTDSSTGIDRGANGRGTLVVVVPTAGNPTTDVAVVNGVTVGGVLPWMTSSRAEFMRLNAVSKAIENVPSTSAPANLSTWVTAMDYRVGNNTTFTPSGEIGNVTINSLGIYAANAIQITIGSANTLTIASGGIVFQPVGSGQSSIRGGRITSGTDQLYIMSGESSGGRAFAFDTEISGNGLDVIIGGVGDIQFTGTVANTYSGTTYVNNGPLWLRKAGGAVAIPGNLVIERGASVRVETGGNQLAPNSSVTINEGGMFYLSGSSVVHGGPILINGGIYQLGNLSPIAGASGTGLQFNGGRIHGRGTFNLQTDVSYASDASKQAVWYRTGAGAANLLIELDGTNRVFTIADSATLPPETPEMVIGISITNGNGIAANSGIIKNGTGTLQLNMTNYYAGGTIINAGTLHVANYVGNSRTGLRAAAYQQSSAWANTLVFHEPVATNLVVGQTITGTGISANQAVLDIVNEYEIQCEQFNIATNVLDLAVDALHRSGSLGTGPVTNNGGTLLVDAGITLPNSITLNGGSITNHGTLSGPLVVHGGTLTGSGVYSGAATLYGGEIYTPLQNGATVNGNLRPGGTSIGTLTVNGNVTWNSGTSWSTATDWFFQLGPAGTSDLLAIDGDFLHGAGSAFRFDFGGTAEAGTFTLVSWTGSTDFDDADFSAVNLGAGFSANFQIVGSSLQVVIAGCAENPTITLGDAPDSLCSPGSDFAASLAYSALSGSPGFYSIDFSDAANTVGFTDTLPSVIPDSQLPITIPAGVAGGVYTGRVIVINGEGCEGETEFTITVLATPAMPGSITQGNPSGTTVCAGDVVVTYSVAPVSGATTYTWSVPAKATIVAGQGTTQLTVNWAADTGAGALTISVNAGNTCGTSADREGSFTIRTGVPGAPDAEEPTDVSITAFTANWSAPAFVDGHQVEGYELDVATASDFSSGFIVNNLSLSSSTLYYNLSGLEGGLTYYYRVRAFNACGASADSDTVTALTPLVLVGWDVASLAGGSGAYGASPLDATFKHDAVGLVGLTRGAGVTQSGTGAPRGWGGTGWNAASAVAAATANQVATFTVTPQTGNYLSFYAINLFDYRRSGDGPTHGELAYSTDGSTFHSIATVSYSSSIAEGGTLASLPVDLSAIAALQNVSENDTITFRIANYGASSANGDWYIYDRYNSSAHDFEIRGTVCSNPPAFNVTGGGSYCDGGTGVAVGLSGSTVGVTYHLYRDSGGLLVASRAGTGSALSFGYQTAADTYTVTAVRNSGGCDSVMNGSAVITINPTPGAPTDLVAVPGESSVELTWTAPVGDTVTGYRVKRATTSGGSYSVVTGGDNIGGTSFTDSSALVGAIYFYVVTALNDGCKGDPSDEAEAVMPDGCPPGFVPTMNNPGNRTANVGYALSHAVTASEITEGCTAPFLSQSALPTGMTFSDSVNGQNRTRTFSWTPLDGQQGVYPITVTATDNEILSTSVTFVVHVGHFGESGNGTATPPPSQANWFVAITNLDHLGGDSHRVIWKTAPGVAYDVYRATSFPGGSWEPASSSQVTLDTSNNLTIIHSGERTYVQVVPSGGATKTNGVWAIITPTIPVNFSLQGAPLPSDRNFNGTFGAALAAALPENTEISIMTPGNNASWTTLRRNGVGQWILISGPNQTTLNPGQGFVVNRPSGSAAPLFAGAVGNDASKFLTLVPGYNLIALSEGRSLAASSAFEAAGPYGDPNGDFALSDQISILQADGSWRRLMRRANGTWYDTVNPNASGNTSFVLTPGASYYYIRRAGGTTVNF